MAKGWQELVKELDEKHGNPDYYIVEDFEVLGDISLVDKPANRQEFVVVKNDGGVAELQGEELDGLVGEVVETLETEKDVDTARSFVRKVAEALIPRLRAKEAQPGIAPKAENAVEPTQSKEVDMEEIEKLKTQLEASQVKIAELEAKNVETEKSAHLAKVEAEVDAWVRDGKVVPAQREFLVAAMSGEAVTVKSADGNEASISGADAMRQFVEAMPVRIEFGEVAKAADRPDFGRFGGRTVDEFADAVLVETGRKPGGDNTK